MKNVGLITIHKAHNYGAVLQSIALQKAILDLGINCELIDYEPPITQRRLKVFIKDFSIMGCLRNFRSLFGYKRLKRRIQAFESFINETQILSKEKYEKEEDFISKKLEYEYCLTGSDQLFGLHLRQDWQSMKPYFLEYVTGKRISYAPSCGEKIAMNTPAEEAWLSERFKAYDNLSVRDQKSADYIEKLTGKRPEVVVDPTLLLTADEWSNYERPFDVNEDYILFYSVLSDDVVVKAVQDLAKKTGLKVIAPHLKNRFEIFVPFKRCDYIGPGEFLSLIKNAKYIVTTSFHATIFAINYKKEFSSFLLGEGNRISSILSDLKLSDRLAKTSEELYMQYQTKVDFSEAGELLEKERAKSFSFLKNALEIKEENGNLQ